MTRMTKQGSIARGALTMSLRCAASVNASGGVVRTPKPPLSRTRTAHIRTFFSRTRVFEALTC
jgi:hypothetical protein